LRCLWRYEPTSAVIENLNLLVEIKFLNLFLYSYKKITLKFTVPNKVLLVLGQRTDAHCEDWSVVMVLWSEITFTTRPLKPPFGCKWTLSNINLKLKVKNQQLRRSTCLAVLLFSITVRSRLISQSVFEIVAADKWYYYIDAHEILRFLIKKPLLFHPMK
jgi:hypothetical protein